jgi:VanZ family protein
MIYEIECPYCGAELYVPSSVGADNVLCSKCKASYLAMFGVLVMSSWHLEPSKSSPRLSKRIYFLRIEAQGKVQPLRLALPAQHDVLNLVPNDRLLILRTKHRLTLALVMNFTAGWKVLLISNQNRHVANLVGVAIAITVFGYLLGSNVLQRFLPARIASVVGVGVSVPIALVVIKKFAAFRLLRRTKRRSLNYPSNNRCFNDSGLFKRNLKD